LKKEAKAQPERKEEGRCYLCKIFKNFYYECTRKNSKGLF
jgi:hypothetical protein